MRSKLILISIITALFSSCFDEDEKFDNTRKGNFDALWTILNEKYCFFDYKNINWDDVYNRYSHRINDNMSSEALFYVMGEMLDELQDGHVNLVSPFDITRYSDWYDSYPRNFYIDLIENDNYLGKDYKTASGLKYKVFLDNIGYVYYNSFTSGVGRGNLNEVIKRMLACDGIIIDVRSNGGGNLTNSEKLTEPFMREKTHVGYMQHKTGKGHNDFSEPYAIYVEPFSGWSYLKPVVVLTNRRTFSAANDFVNAMKCAPNVTILGDKTGGGGGMPFSSELPNGWSVRFSASPMLTVDKEQVEFGIEPNIRVDLEEADRQREIDTIIEEARKHIKNSQGLN